MAVGPVTAWIVEEDDGVPALHFATLVRVNSPWRYYRNDETGDEWKENGVGRWHFTKESALRDYIRSRMPSPERSLLNSVFGGPSPEEDFRAMVAACAMLWQLWKKQKPFNKE